jgi:class 3 adenylate cyclase
LEPSPTDEPGQRRLVSVLFADLVGFTTISESRDPEEVRAMLTKYFDRSREVIESFGGEVDKYTGDAITAFWGAHQTQEDDAERAVRAALELVSAVGVLGKDLGIPDLMVRAGVLTGEASVGSGGNEKGLVVGDIVNTAARLQSIAEPDTVFVGDATYALTCSGIRYESAGEHDLKGKSAPVHAWRALDIAGEVGGRGRAESLEAPFVGREDELRLLKDAVHATSREKRARLVSIVGEAGIGKSRLAWELQKYTDGLTDIVFVHEGRSPSYGEGITFWALGEMVRQRARIAEGDDPLKSRTRLRTMVAEHLSDPEEQKWIEPRLAGLLGLDEMPAGDRSELFSALRTFFQRMTEKGTVLLVFEDLHWADSGLLEFITELVEWSAKYPILIVTLARSDFLEKHPGWGSGRRHSTSTHLGPLSDVDMAALVRGLAPGISDDVAENIVGQAAGIPMYAVEFVRMLVGSGDLVRKGDRFEMTGAVDSLAIPDSLRSVIAARLDRLDDEQRTIIQNASVLGLSFHADGLSIFGDHPDTEANLRGLIHNEILEFDADERSPERGQYRFLQSVIREVAYSRLAKADRRDRHIQVAEYYESLGDEEYSPIVASHYIDAYAADPSDEMGAVTRRALQKAAERAAKLHSLDQVLALAERAIELANEASEAASLHQLAANAAAEQLQFEIAIEHATNAFDYYRAEESTERTTEAAVLLGHIHMDALHPSTAIEVMAPFLDEGFDTPGQAKLVGALARAYMMNTQYEEGNAVVDRGLELAEIHRDHRTFADTIVTKGTLLLSVSRPQEGALLLRGALDYAEEHGFARAANRALNNLIVVEAADGTRGSGELYARGMELAERHGNVQTANRMASGQAGWLTRMYRFDEALELVDDAAGYVDYDFFRMIQNFARALAAWTQTGDSDAVLEARAYLRTRFDDDDPQLRASAYGLTAELFLATGDYQVALEEAKKVGIPAPWIHPFEIALTSALFLGDRESLDDAAEFAEGWQSPGRRLDGHRLMIEAGEAMLNGETTDAIAAFVSLIDLYDEALTNDWGVYARLAFASAVGLDIPEARHAAEEAYATLDGVGAYHLLETRKDVFPPQSAEAAS